MSGVGEIQDHILREIAGGVERRDEEARDALPDLADAFILTFAGRGGSIPRLADQHGARMGRGLLMADQQVTTSEIDWKTIVQEQWENAGQSPM